MALVLFVARDGAVSCIFPFFGLFGTQPAVHRGLPFYPRIRPDQGTIFHDVTSQKAKLTVHLALIALEYPMPLDLAMIAIVNPRGSTFTFGALFSGVSRKRAKGAHGNRARSPRAAFDVMTLVFAKGAASRGTLRPLDP